MMFSVKSILGQIYKICIHSRQQRVKEYRSHSSLLLNWSATCCCIFFFFKSTKWLKSIVFKEASRWLPGANLPLCVFVLVLISCVIAAAILLPLAILAAWLIYKVYRFLYPKTKLPELLKVCVSCGSTPHYICNIHTFSLSDHTSVLFI